MSTSCILLLYRYIMECRHAIPFNSIISLHLFTQKDSALLLDVETGYVLYVC
eukprot:m.562902 g.562902  ORF g.562902 m.562902 type:complete len:52 (-) comp22227_c0_seq10:1434-1589(-)